MRSKIKEIIKQNCSVEIPEEDLNKIDTMLKKSFLVDFIELCVKTKVEQSEESKVFAWIQGNILKAHKIFNSIKYQYIKCEKPENFKTLVQNEMYDEKNKCGCGAIKGVGHSKECIQRHIDTINNHKKSGLCMNCKLLKKLCGFFTEKYYTAPVVLCDGFQNDKIKPEDSGEIKSIKAFFDAMVCEFGGTDNGCDFVFDDVDVEKSLKPFLEHYLKNIKTA